MSVTEATFPIDEALADLTWDKLGDRCLCDSCLGRLVGHLGHGMTNRQRGGILRPRLGALKGGGCWLCAGLLDEVGKFATLIEKSLEGWEYETFLVGSRISPEVAAREEALWADVGSAHAEPLKVEINREVGKLVEAATGKVAEFERPDVVAIIETAFDVVELQVNSLFIRGRYRKLTRGIPQTRWPCRKCLGKGCDYCGGKGKMYETSVEEVIASKVMEQSGGSGHALHGLGREDIDARMLGRGRPFVVEIMNPKKRKVDLQTAAGAISSTGLVEVLDLRPSRREEIVKLKDERCDKTYRLLAKTASPVSMEKLKEGIASLLASPVAQRTPFRVSHRRADRIRERRVKSVEVAGFDGSLVELVIRAEAGSYVKELVHGDRGRTEPSLAGVLGVPCEVLELDVLEVHDEE